MVSLYEASQYVHPIVVLVQVDVCCRVSIGWESKTSVLAPVCVLFKSVTGPFAVCGIEVSALATLMEASMQLSRNMWMVPLQT